MAEKALNPWDEGYVDPTENTVGTPQVQPQVQTQGQELNPWDEGYDLSPMQSGDLSRETPMSDLHLGKTPDKTLENVSKNVEYGHMIDEAEANSPDDVVGPDVYDRIQRSNPVLNKWDDYWGDHTRGEAAFNSLQNIPDSLVQQISGTDRKTLSDMWNQRENEKISLYNRIGRQEGALGANYWGDYPMRIQRRVKPNIDYDPNQPESETNSQNVTEKYFVPPPDQNAIIRIGYQVARDLAGLADLGYDAAVHQKLNLSETGPVRGAMPQMPMKTSEKFVADMTSMAIGPGLAGKTLKEGAAIGEMTSASLAARTLSYMSPSVATKTREIYQAAIKSGKSVAEAHKTATRYMSKAVVGTAIGLSESAIAEDDSQGLVPPEYLQSLGADPRTAHDLSLMLDSPIISGTLNSLGFMWNKASNVVGNTVGGAMSISGKRAAKLSENQAGVKVATLLDPQLLNDPPELVATKLKMLTDNMMQESVNDLQLGKVNKQVKNDTVVAFTRSSQRYFRQAYAHLEDSMGTKAFNDWVTDQSTHAANRMFALRTAAQAEDPITMAAAQRSQEVQEMFTDAANAETSLGSVPKSTDLMSQNLAEDQTKIMQQKDLDLSTAQNMAADAKQLKEEGFRNTPEIRTLIDQYKADFPLGSTTKINEKLKSTLGDKLYSSFEKEYGGVQEAYNALKGAGIEADKESLLEKLKDVGYETTTNADGEEITRPINRVFASIRTQIQNANGDYGIIATEVHNRIRGEISKLEKTASNRDSDMVSRLQELDDHIMNEQPDLISEVTGDDTTSELLAEAKKKYIDYKTTWESLPDTRRIADAGKSRYNKNASDLPMGTDGRPQGTAEFNQTAIDTYESRKNDVAGETTDAILNAARKNGQPIDKDLSDVVEMQTVRNLQDKVMTGEQNIGTLRTSLRETINQMQKLNPAGVKKYQDLEAKLGQIDKSAGDTESKARQMQLEFRKLKSDLDNSVAAKFVREVRGGNTPFKYEGVGNPVEVMKTIYRAKDSTNQISELLREADRIGGQKGEQIREAIKGSYLDYIGRSLFTPSKIGLAKVTDEGEAILGRNISGRGLVNVMEDMGIEKNLKLLYGDAYVKQVRDVAKNMDEALLKFNRGQAPDLSLKPGEDPRKGITSVITLMLGVLNPRATTAKRFANPYGEIKADDLMDLKKVALIGAITDPATASKFMTQAVQGQLDAKSTAEFKMWFARAAANTLAKEKDRDYQVPPGVK